MFPTSSSFPFSAAAPGGADPTRPPAQAVALHQVGAASRPVTQAAARHQVGTESRPAIGAGRLGHHQVGLASSMPPRDGAVAPRPFAPPPYVPPLAGRAAPWRPLSSSSAPPLTISHLSGTPYPTPAFPPPGPPPGAMASLSPPHRPLPQAGIFRPLLHPSSPPLVGGISGTPPQPPLPGSQGGISGAPL